MATYNGKYYKPTLVKANQEWQCAITKRRIPKGEYYLHITVGTEVTRMGKYGTPYNETGYLRVSKHTLSEMSMLDILDASDMFLSKDDHIRKLIDENKYLKKKVCTLQHYLAIIYGECDDR